MNLKTKYNIGDKVLIKRKNTWNSWDEYWNDGETLCEGIIHKISYDGTLYYFIVFPQWYPDNFSQHEQDYIREAKIVKKVK